MFATSKDKNLRDHTDPYVLTEITKRVVQRCIKFASAEGLGIHEVVPHGEFTLDASC